MVTLFFYSRAQAQMGREMLRLSEIAAVPAPVPEGLGPYSAALGISAPVFSRARKSLVRAGLLFDFATERAPVPREGARRVYMDYNATAPLIPEVGDLMRALGARFSGNPSSLHYYGRAAAGLLEESRRAVADLVGAEPGEIFFTSGGTESNNAALRGLFSLCPPGSGVITSAIEHASVRRVAEALAAGSGARGFETPVDSCGVVDEGVFHAQLSRGGVGVVSVIMANNEIGAIQDVAGLARHARAAGAFFHADAVQALGKVRFSASGLGVDAMSFSAHKIGGPKGVGALYVRGGLKLPGLIAGGGQERGLRAGTENLIGIAGFAAAAGIAARGRDKKTAPMRAMKQRLYERLRLLPGFSLNGALEGALPNTLNVAFDGVYAESLVNGLDFEGVCASAGAACSAGTVRASHVITALGRSPEEAFRAVRFSFGPGTSASDVDRTARAVAAVLGRVAGRAGCAAAGR